MQQRQKPLGLKQFSPNQYHPYREAWWWQHHQSKGKMDWSKILLTKTCFMVLGASDRVEGLPSNDIILGTNGD